jgi:hypothetical protein
VLSTWSNCLSGRMAAFQAAATVALWPRCARRLGAGPFVLNSQLGGGGCYCRRIGCFPLGWAARGLTVPQAKSRRRCNHTNSTGPQASTVRAVFCVAGLLGPGDRGWGGIRKPRGAGDGTYCGNKAMLVKKSKERRKSGLNRSFCAECIY